MNLVCKLLWKMCICFNSYLELLIRLHISNDYIQWQATHQQDIFILLLTCSLPGRKGEGKTHHAIFVYFNL